VTKRKSEQDLVVPGSASVVRTLMDHDLVDEYRLLVFPSCSVRGLALPDGIAPIDLEVVSAERSGAATLVTYRRARPVR